MRKTVVMLSIVMLCSLALAGARTASIEASAPVFSQSGKTIPVRSGEAVLAPTMNPVTDFPVEETLHFDGDNVNALGLTNGGSFYTAARFTPTTGGSMIAVAFFHGAAATDDQVFIWGPGTETSPGDLVDSAPYTGTLTDWVRVELPRPVALTAGADVWVGPRHTHAAGAYPAGMDGGPIVPTRGGWINYSGSWEEISGVGFDANWNIRAIVSSGPALENDLAVSVVLAPTGAIGMTPVAPRGRINNFGTIAQSEIVVTCWIDSADGRSYEQAVTYPGPLAPGGSAEVTFSPTWHGADGNDYTVRMFTALANDENRSNDTARASVRVSAAAWENIALPGSEPDRLTHATVYSPINDRIYMIGGNPAGNPGTYLGLTQEYNPVTNTWANKAMMTTPRGWIKGSYVKGKIYVIGGHNNSGAAIATNAAYDPIANTWANKAARPRIGLAALEGVWRDSLIYVIGGSDGTNGMPSVDIYDVASNTWSAGTDLSTPLYMGSAVIIGDTIFIAQGIDGAACLPSMLKGVINPDLPTEIAWSDGPALAEPVFDGGTVELDGVIYWAGGFINAQTVTGKLWKYTVATGEVAGFTPGLTWTVTRNNYLTARTYGHELYIMAGDEGGNWQAPNRKYAKLWNGQSGFSEKIVVPTLHRFSIAPNPATAVPTVRYSLSRSGAVSLKMYDISGTLVSTIVSGQAEAGSHSVRVDAAQALPRGVYLLRLNADGSEATEKLVLR